MLISNIDLYHLCVTRPEMGQDSSRSAVEFLKYFPQARNTFRARDGHPNRTRHSLTRRRLSVCRLSPRRRLVDAGYYDNYGVNLAANWAYNHRDWIVENTSGLALIQLHAYETRTAKRNAFVVVERATNVRARLFHRFNRGFGWATDPGVAAVSASKKWSMSFRNDEQVRVLHDYFNSRAGGLFAAFEFENPVDFAMNWFLSNDDIKSHAATVSRTTVIWRNCNAWSRGGTSPHPAFHAAKEARMETQRFLAT